jgi:hypothetical protein
VKLSAFILPSPRGGEGPGGRGKLLLDLDNRPGENEIFEELVKYGCEGVAAPSCASKYVHYFASALEKVIVIGGTWTLVQSGNYSDNSIPANEGDGVPGAGHFFPGNRDTGVAVHSRELAAFFTGILRADIKRELRAEPVPDGLGHRAEGPGEAGGSSPRSRWRRARLCG